MKKITESIVLLFMAVIAILAGCGRQPDARLLKAENIIQEYPDSALMILDSIEYKHLLRDDDKALYGMLITEALDKNHLNPSNDSLISFAVDYYRNNKDTLREIISSYYQGRVYFLNGDNMRAIISYLQAKELAQNNGKYFWAGMARRGITHFYNGTYNDAEELAYARKSYEFMQKSGRQPYLNYALLDLGKALNNNRQGDEAITIADQLMDSVISYGDMYLLYQARQLKLHGLLSEDRINECIELCPLVVKSEFAEASDSLYHALLYLKVDKTDRAVDILNKVSDKNSPVSKIVQFSITEKSGNYKKAFNEALSLDTLIDIKLKSSLGHELTSSIVEYFELKKQLSEVEMENARIKLWIIVFFCILLFSIFIVLGWRAYSRYKKDIYDKVNLAEQLMELLNRSNLKNKKSISIIQNLTSSKYQVLEELNNLVVGNIESKGDKSRLSKVVARIIDRISINSEKIAILEKETDTIYDNLYSDFKNDLPGMKDADYHLFLFSVYGLTNASICLLLKEDKIESIYNRKRRLKDKIKKLDADKITRYMQFFRTNDVG